MTFRLSNILAQSVIHKLQLTLTYSCVIFRQYFLAIVLNFLAFFKGTIVL